jgi:hypothetical protein
MNRVSAACCCVLAPCQPTQSTRRRPRCPFLSQRGNFLAAVLLLDRSAALEPRNRPVLRWKPVVEARQTVGARRAAKGATSPPAS